MELNTEVWGTGISDFSDFKYCASTLAQLISDGKISRDELIDPSAYYCYSYASKLNSYKYVLATATANNLYLEIKSSETAPFTNFGFSRVYGYSGNYYPGASYTNNLAIGFFKDSATPPNYTGSRQMYISYALKKLRACCYVKYYVTNGLNATYSLPHISTTGEMTLKDFINSQYYNTFLNPDIDNDGVYIYEMYWKLYYNGADRSNKIIPVSIPNAINAPTQWSSMYDSVYFFEPHLEIKQGGAVMNNSMSDITQYTMPLFFSYTSDNWHIEGFHRSGSNVDIACVLYPEKLMDAFHEFAYAGLFYTNNTTTAASTTLSDDDLFLGEMHFGRTNGKYAQFSSNDSEDDSTAKAGETNPDVLNSEDPSSNPNSGYNGETDPSQVDPNEYSQSTPLASPAISTIDVFNRSFAMNITQIRNLADWLWNADDDEMTEIIAGLELMGENPMNALIDCRLYPFAITDMIGHAGYELIKIGRTQSTVGGVKLTNTSNCIIDLGQCIFFEDRKNFLDYSPHTQARLYVPYCGWHTIDPAEFMGKRIHAKLIVDVVTGACNCIIYANNIILINATGTIGVEIPMTGTDSAAFASQTINASMQCISNIVQAGAGVIGGMGNISKGTELTARATNVGISSNTRAADYKLGSSMQTEGGQQFSTGLGAVADAVYAGWKAHTVPVQYEMAGAATPACANWLPQYAYFVIDRPVPLIPENYGHTVGFACCESGLLSGFSGFTVCTNVDTSGFAQATESERAELKALLEAGVYL